MTDTLRDQDEGQQLRIVQGLLARQRRVESLVRRQDMPRHQLVEDMVHKQHLSELKSRLDRMAPDCLARMLEALPQSDSVLVWELLAPERGNEILDQFSDALRKSYLASQASPATSIMLSAFDLQNGRLHQIPIGCREDLAQASPIWIDLIAPSHAERKWIEEIFGLHLPGTEDLTDLEESARCYIEDNGEVHLHSYFLLDKEDESRSVAVAFILHNNILFSMRAEELPVFRLQRLRARIQPGYVTEGKDVLIDLYAADVEYSAAALEDIYGELETVGRTVLSPQVSDDRAAEILSRIARQEDLNGRIRRNVLDTRRALSFLIRGRLLSADQHEDTRQILRDIESLDGHTSFLFGKINFLMDTTVGFININQNKRVSSLTTFSVIFMPMNILAGIGGMSEFSMMTRGLSWPVAYSAFVAGVVVVGWLTFASLRFLEKRRHRKSNARES